MTSFKLVQMVSIWFKLVQRVGLALRESLDKLENMLSTWLENCEKIVGVSIYVPT